MPGWLVVRSNPAREQIAAKQLRLHGYRSYLPLYLKSRALIPRPLFENYLFAELAPRQPWHPIKHLIGVHGLLMRGSQPALLPEALIEGIRAQVDACEYDDWKAITRRDLSEYLSADKLVTVRVPEWNGVLAQLRAVDEHGRAEVLLSLALGRRDVLATVNASMLEVVAVS